MSKAYDLLKVSNSVADSLDINFNKTKKVIFVQYHSIDYMLPCEGYLTACCVDYQNYLTIADLNLVSIGDAWKSKAFRES